MKSNKVGRPKLVISNNIIQQYKKEKITVQQIADIMKCHYSTVHRYLKMLGIPKRPRKISERNLLIFNTYQSGKTANELGNEFNVSYQRIQRIVSKVSKRLNQEPRDRVRPKCYVINSHIPEDLVLKYKNGEITQKEIAVKMSRNISTVGIRLREMGLHGKNNPIFDWPTMYQLWIAGEDGRELSQQFGCTFGSFYGGMWKYTKRNNLPLKRANNKNKAKI